MTSQEVVLCGEKHLTAGGLHAEDHLTHATFRGSYPARSDRCVNEVPHLDVLDRAARAVTHVDQSASGQALVEDGGLERALFLGGELLQGQCLRHRHGHRLVEPVPLGPLDRPHLTRFQPQVVAGVLAPLRHLVVVRDDDEPAPTTLGDAVEPGPRLAPAALGPQPDVAVPARELLGHLDLVGERAKPQDVVEVADVPAHHLDLAVGGELRPPVVSRHQGAVRMRHPEADAVVGQRALLGRQAVLHLEVRVRPGEVLAHEVRQPLGDAPQQRHPGGRERVLRCRCGAAAKAESHFGKLYLFSLAGATVIA